MLQNLDLKHKETELYSIYAASSLDFITSKMMENLNVKIKEYHSLFNIKNFRKIQINLFDDKEQFRKFIFELRGENTLPIYAVGTFDNGMINAYIENNVNRISTSKYFTQICMPAHELFHIMYKELILQKDFSNRIIWFDEGMAQNFSGEKDYLITQEKFNEYFKTIYENTKIMPNLNDICHEKGMKNENYNGYDLSYLCVRYLKETLSMNELKYLMKDFNKIKEIGKTVLNDAFNYYSDKLENKKNK